MFSIFKKEISSFFSSLIGYVVIGTFLLFMGLFMWVFPDYSVLEFGFASMNQLFELAPWIFCFLIPAVTMRSFSEEMQTGTIELLSTRPLQDLEIILGKFFACWALVGIGLIPTVLYYYTVYQLGSPVGNIDSGEVIGSYIGLLLLAGAFVSVGVFASTLTNNQIVAFVLSMFLCFTFYMAFDFISAMPIFFGGPDLFVEKLGINYHYNLVSRGAIDSRDVLYFLSFMTAFVWFTKTSLERRKW